MGQKEQEQVSSFSSTSTSTSTSSTLRRAIQFISSLISLTFSIKIFASKWKTITQKLEDLNSNLSAIENCSNSSSDEKAVVPEILLGILSNTLSTITECHNLAKRCVDLSYSGKLLMQSDLNKLAAKLDHHSTNLAAFYAADAVHRSLAVVVSKPATGACRDDVRFYVRDLITRMRIGDVDMKIQALKNLQDSVFEEEKYVKIVVEQSEVVGLLIGFLDCDNEVEIQDGSVKIVSLISGFDLYRGILVGAGVIAPLIRVLESGSEIGREGAAMCLERLTENADNGWSISAHGGVSVLLKVCENEASSVGLESSACGVLKNLVGVEEIKRFMVDEGAVSIFVRLVRSKEEALQINAIEFLQNVAYGDEGVRSLVVREGGIRALLLCVTENRSESCCRVREIALRAIEKLCFCCSTTVGVLIKYGFVEQLMYILRNGEVSSQELALKVAIRLCEASEEAKRAMGDADFMTELVKFLDSKSFEVREMAAEALSSMVLIPKNRKRFLQDDRNIGLLLQRFDPDQLNAGNKKFLFSILMSLTSCNSGRRKIAHSGYLKNIEKLAEAEVTDAKRLVKKLSTNRFRTMLSGIWHS